MSDLVIDGVSVTHGSTLAVDEVSLRIDGGDLVAVLGPSGCGKTTLLLAIAGLLPVGAGSIRIGERELSRPGRTVPAEKRGIGWVPQEASLFPHLSVAENIGFALARGHGAASVRAQCAGGAPPQAGTCAGLLIHGGKAAGMLGRRLFFVIGNE